MDFFSGIFDDLSDGVSTIEDLFTKTNRYIETEVNLGKIAGGAGKVIKDAFPGSSGGVATEGQMGSPSVSSSASGAFGKGGTATESADYANISPQALESAWLNRLNAFGGFAKPQTFSTAKVTSGASKLEQIQKLLKEEA